MTLAGRISGDLTSKLVGNSKITNPAASGIVTTDWAEINAPAFAKSQMQWPAAGPSPQSSDVSLQHAAEPELVNVAAPQ
jgi:hypothetical protein